MRSARQRRRHYRLTLGDALAAHDAALAFGGIQGIPHLGLVKSAIARPYSGYYRSIERKAAALVESLARNHGFADGNKRTCLILLALLLTRSGYYLAGTGSPAAQRRVEQMIVRVARGELSYEGIEAWMRVNVRQNKKA